MKNELSSVMKMIVPALVLAAIFLLPPRVSSQDTLTAKPEKKVAVKIKMDGDGASFDFDTMFVIDNDFNEEALEQAMEQYQQQMKTVGRQMEKMKKMKEMKEMQVHWSCDPDQMEHLEMCAPGRSHCFFKTMPHAKGETLSDVLGDIPMSAVISYQIKETKGGKRITIEISDDAMIGSPDHKIMILRHAGPHQRQVINREILIDTGSDVADPEEVEPPVKPETPEE